MKKSPNKAAGVLALPITILAVPVSVLAFLLGPSFEPTPNSSWPVVTAMPTPILDQAIVTGGVSMDATCSMISENKNNQSAPDNGNFPDLPDSTSDIDDDDGGLDDLSADTFGGYDQDTALFSMTDLDATTLQRPPIVSIRCFYCLHQHLRERAPPMLG